MCHGVLILTVPYGRILLVPFDPSELFSIFLEPFINPERIYLAFSIYPLIIFRHMPWWRMKQITHIFLEVTAELYLCGLAPSFATHTYTLGQAISGIISHSYANYTVTQLLVIYTYPISWWLQARKEKDTKAMKNIALHLLCSGLSGS